MFDGVDQLLIGVVRFVNHADSHAAMHHAAMQATTQNSFCPHGCHVTHRGSQRQIKYRSRDNLYIFLIHLKATLTSKH